MVLSESIAISSSTLFADSALRADPTRIAAQIITGIGFLGAGVIIKSGSSIRGLTTAASLWLTAGIGMSIGAGYFDIGVAATSIGLFTLVGLSKIEKIYPKDSYRILEILTSNDTDLSGLINLIKQKHIKIMHLDKERNYIENTMKASFTIKLHHKGITDKLSHELIANLEKSKIKLLAIKWSH